MTTPLGLVEEGMDEPLKLLVTGASGLLGRAIMLVAKRREMHVTGLALTRATGGLHKCDLTIPGEFESLLNDLKPDVIIHAAAERFPDRVEKQYEATRTLNVDVSGRLAAAAKQAECRFIYVSTDYVFDGQCPPYKTSDIPKPLNKYGQTKFDGEMTVLQNNSTACILRIPVLYGDIEYLGESAVTTLLTNVKCKQPQLISHTQKRYPSSTKDIANVLCDLALIINTIKSLFGFFQWCGKEQMTKYDMAVAIAEAFSLSHAHLQPDNKPSAAVTRPYDCLMDTSRLGTFNIDHHTPFANGIKECLNRWV